MGYHRTLALAELEMLVLQDPRERCLGIGVVYYSIALEVISIRQILCLKLKTSVLELAKGIIIILVLHLRAKRRADLPLARPR